MSAKQMLQHLKKKGRTVFTEFRGQEDGTDFVVGGSEEPPETFNQPWLAKLEIE